jgi:tetratricopeptide (TPR) repeat protein
LGPSLMAVRLPRVAPQPFPSASHVNVFLNSRRVKDPVAFVRASADVLLSQRVPGSVWRDLLGHGSGCSCTAGERTRRRASARTQTENGYVLLPGSTWEMLLRAAQNPAVFSRKDRLQRSRTRYAHHRAARKQSPPEQKHLHRKAMVQARKGRTKEAIDMMKRGIEAYPENSFFPQSIGVIYARQRKFQKAEEYLQLALEVDPGNSSALQALARLHAKKGNVERARQLFQEAFDVRPSFCWLCLFTGAFARKSRDKSRTTAG